MESTIIGEYDYYGNERIYNGNVDMGAAENDSISAAIQGSININPIFLLFPAYPNPFNPQTEITYQLSNSGLIELTIFDSLGRKIITLEKGYRAIGKHTVKWNAADYSGKRCASGVYFARLQSAKQFKVIKLLLVR